MSKARHFKCAAAKAISLILLFAATTSAPAIILLGSSDPNQNTTPPAGSLADSGWDLQGNWGVFQGTPIGPHHFITAAHVGGVVGTSFFFRNVFYKTVSVTKDPETDLQIWEVAGTFPDYAQLYDGPAETGRELVVFGRGPARGDEVSVGGALKGWKWGPWDVRLRWGRNVVAALVDAQFGQPIGITPPLLKMTFDASGGPNEAHLAGGDSGGAVFIQQGSVWRLAGINYSVDGYFNTTTEGSGFGAALTDMGGLYRGTEGSWTPVADLPLDQPSAFYATRILPRIAWIQSVLAQPITPILLESPDISGSYTASSNATIEVATKTIRVPVSETRFFELQSSGSLRITSSRLEGSTLVLQYE